MEGLGPDYDVEDDRVEGDRENEENREEQSDEYHSDHAAVKREVFNYLLIIALTLNHGAKVKCCINIYRLLNF